MEDKLVQILYQDKHIKWKREIGYIQNGQFHQPNVLIGFLLDSVPYAVWDIYQGIIQRVGQDTNKLVISSSQIIDINYFIEGLLLILTKNEGIYLYDPVRNQIRICFNEYLKYVKNPLRMRFSIDTIYLGYKDGYLSLWEITHSIARHLDDDQQENGVLLVQDCQARFHLTESVLIDFDVDGYRVMTLQENYIEILALDIIVKNQAHTLPLEIGYYFNQRLGDWKEKTWPL